MEMPGDDFCVNDQRPGQVGVEGYQPHFQFEGQGYGVCVDDNRGQADYEVICYKVCTELRDD